MGDMATTVLFSTAQGGTNFNNLGTTADQVVTAANGLDISTAVNLRILFRAPSSRSLMFTVKIAAAGGTNTNSDVQVVLDTVTVAAGATTTKLYPLINARILRIAVRLASGTQTNVAVTCIVMGN